MAFKGFKRQEMRTIGVEPTNIARIANKDGIETIQDFFSEKVADEISLIMKGLDNYCTNMFAHIANLGDIIRGIEKLLDDEEY